MAKEINLFEVEKSEIEETAPLKPSIPAQMTLPGMMETLQEQEEKRGLERQMRLQIKRIIEAVLFASHEPVSFNKLREIADMAHPLKPKQLKDLIEDLKEEYISQGRAFRLYEIAEGYLLKSCEEYGRFIEKLGLSKRQEKLSQPALEVLAIVAFKGPITRPQIDQIRGVDSSGTLQNLTERGLVEQNGKLEAPGRPSIYHITPQFLKYFGLRDLTELPKFEALQL
jgi:segregation and condensation protein B